MQGTEFTALFHSEGKWNLQHPVLDRVRRCSAEPEKAAELFGRLLDPGLHRTTAHQALNTPYLKGLNLELQEHYKPHPLKPCKPQASSQAPLAHSFAGPSQGSFKLPVTSPAQVSSHAALSSSFSSSLFSAPSTPLLTLTFYPTVQLPWPPPPSLLPSSFLTP